MNENDNILKFDNNEMSEVIEYAHENERNMEGESTAQSKVTKKAIFTLLIIVYINLLNYMDRFTVSSK